MYEEGERRRSVLFRIFDTPLGFSRGECQSVCVFL